MRLGLADGSAPVSKRAPLISVALSRALQRLRPYQPHRDRYHTARRDAPADLALARWRSWSTSSSDLSCIGLVTTLGEVVEDGLGVVGDAWWGGDLLVAEADGGCSAAAVVSG